MCREALIHLEFIKAKLCCLRIRSQHFNADFFKTSAVLRKQFDLRINQCCNRIDFFFAANVQNRIKIVRVIDPGNKIMLVCHIQGWCQIGQVSGNNSVILVHRLSEILQQFNAPSGTAK